MIKIAQISDIHIPNEGEESYGIDTKSNFLKVLDDVKTRNCSALILTGDLAFSKPSEEIYTWVSEKLIKLSIPYYVMPGNHDQDELFKRFFESNHPESYLKKISNEFLHFFSLNSASGNVTESMITELTANSEEFKKNIIFMHHPPMNCGVRYMDNKHPLKNSTLLQEAIHSLNNEYIFFCGHYHCSKITAKNKITVAICPSSFYQINQDSENFTIDTYKIGYRIIEIEKDTISFTDMFLDAE